MFLKSIIKLIWCNCVLNIIYFIFSVMNKTQVLILSIKSAVYITYHVYLTTYQSYFLNTDSQTYFCIVEPSQKLSFLVYLSRKLVYLGTTSLPCCMNDPSENQIELQILKSLCKIIWKKKQYECNAFVNVKLRSSP